MKKQRTKDDEVQLATSDDSDSEDVAVSKIVDDAAAQQRAGVKNEQNAEAPEEGTPEAVENAAASELGEIIDGDEVAALAKEIEAEFEAVESADVPQPDEEEEVELKHSPKKSLPSPKQLWLTKCMERIRGTKSLSQSAKNEAQEALDQFRSDDDASAVYTAFALATGDEWAGVVKRTVALAGEPPGGWRDAPAADAPAADSDADEDVPLRVKKPELLQKAKQKKAGGQKKRKASAKAAREQEETEEGAPLSTDKRVKRIVDSWANLKSIRVHQESPVLLREVRDTDEALCDLEGACAHAKLVSYVRKQRPTEKDSRVQNIANMLYLMLATATTEYSDVASVIQYTKNTKRELAQTHICLDILNKSAEDRRSLEVVYNFHEAIAEFAKRV
jgi:hypothetical protein